MGDLHWTVLIPSFGCGLTFVLIHHGIAEVTSANKGASPKKKVKRTKWIFWMLGCMMLWRCFYNKHSIWEIKNDQQCYLQNILSSLLCFTDHLMCLWITEIKSNNNIMIKYHPKFWADGSYQCCRQTEKLAPGCEK